MSNSVLPERGAWNIIRTSESLVKRNRGISYASGFAGRRRGRVNREHHTVAIYLCSLPPLRGRSNLHKEPPRTLLRMIGDKVETVCRIDQRLTYVPQSISPQ